MGCTILRIENPNTSIFNTLFTVVTFKKRIHATCSLYKALQNCQSRIMSLNIEIAAFSLTRSPLIRLNKQSDINTLVSKAQRGRLTRARLCFYPYPFWACARPWGTAEENQVLTQHENRWQSKCGASWEISPLWACHCIPLDGFSHVFAMTAAWWKHQPTPGQREREGGKNRKSERRGGRRVQSNQILHRDHMTSQHEFCLRA